MDSEIKQMCQHKITTVMLNSWSSVTIDYQLIADPAYNADRGPVHVFSGRLHAQF